MKTQVQLLESARKGNLDALVALINQPLVHKGITASVSVANRCLTVTAEAPEAPPEKSFFVNFVKQGINTLKPSGVERVVVRGKLEEDARILWRDHFLVDASSHTPGSIPFFKSVEETPTAFNLNGATPKPVRRPLPVFGFLWASSFLLGALLTATVLGWFMPQRLARTTWEYRIVSIEDQDFNSAMTELGKEGWELTYARRAVADGGDSEYSLYELIFKRPKSPLDRQSNRQFDRP